MNIIKWLSVVTATCDCGRVMAILYCWLAMRLRSLAILLPIHLCLLSLQSMFATVYHKYHPYTYKAKLERMRPYHIIAFSVNGYVSLIECHEFTPLPMHHMIKDISLKNDISKHNYWKLRYPLYPQPIEYHLLCETRHHR